MNHPFIHPASNFLILAISKIFKKKLIYQKRDRHIIFLCGGPINLYSRSLRSKFIKYAKKNIKNFRIFIAEAATKELSKNGKPEFLNIADFESFIADLADCVLIFPESEGSISELSYFSNDKKILDKILIANDIKEQHSSFINMGPIDKVNENSLFKPTIIIDFRSPEFNTVKKRLEDRLLISSSKRFRYKVFSKLNPKEKLFVIFQLLYIFKVLTLEGIFYCIKEIFKDNVEIKEIRHILSFLVAVEYLKRVDEDSDYFTPHRNSDPFLEFRNYDVADLQAKTAYYFSRYHRESYDLLKEI